MNIIKWFKNLFKREEKGGYVPSIDILRWEVEKSLYHLKQEQENRKRILEAKREAFEMFQQWEERRWKEKAWNAQYPTALVNPYEELGIFIPKYRSPIILVYPGQKCISSEEYKEIRDKEFNRLKEEYLLTSP